MRYRKLSLSGDRIFGHGQQDFWRDQPEAVGQAIWTRLRLWYGQWFLKPQDGTDWQHKVLGKYTGSTADPTIRARILSTPGATSIEGYSSSLDRDTRKWSVSANVNTSYGKLTLAGPL